MLASQFTIFLGCWTILSAEEIRIAGGETVGIQARTLHRPRGWRYEGYEVSGWVHVSQWLLEGYPLVMTNMAGKSTRNGGFELENHL